MSWVTLLSEPQILHIWFWFSLNDVFNLLTLQLSAETLFLFKYPFVLFLHCQVLNVSDFIFLHTGYSVLQSSLTLLLEEGDFDSELRFKTVNVTKMATYILTQMMRAFEEKLTHDSRSGILIETGKVIYDADIGASFLNLMFNNIWECESCDPSHRATPINLTFTWCTFAEMRV
jgi:hypothetical protein